MSNLKHLFEKNRQWAAGNPPELFDSLAKGQSPKILWIGCSDSRVPPEVIMGLEPGELFVHRNIANLFPKEDSNSHAAVQVAVDLLKVEHIIVCGHYGCSGIAAAMEGKASGPLGTWLGPAQAHYKQSNATSYNHFIELSVLEQLKHLSSSPLLKGKNITLHGWVYDVATGLLKDLIP